MPMCRCIVRSYAMQRFNYRDFMNNYVIVSP